MRKRQTKVSFGCNSEISVPSAAIEFKLGQRTVLRQNLGFPSANRLNSSWAVGILPLVGPGLQRKVIEYRKSIFFVYLSVKRLVSSMTTKRSFNRRNIKRHEPSYPPFPKDSSVMQEI